MQEQLAAIGCTEYGNGGVETSPARYSCATIKTADHIGAHFKSFFVESEPAGVQVGDIFFWCVR